MGVPGPVWPHSTPQLKRATKEINRLYLLCLHTFYIPDKYKLLVCLVYCIILCTRPRLTAEWKKYMLDIKSFLSLDGISLYFKKVCISDGVLHFKIILSILGKDFSQLCIKLFHYRYLAQPLNNFSYT